MKLSPREGTRVLRGSEDADGKPSTLREPVGVREARLQQQPPVGFDGAGEVQV